MKLPRWSITLALWLVRKHPRVTRVILRLGEAVLGDLDAEGGARIIAEYIWDEPPPFKPDLDAIRWLEDPCHGPSRPKTWRCWLSCPHRGDDQC
jgi:hypothetical protein